MFDLNEHPSGRILAFSREPFLKRQDAILRKCLGQLDFFENGRTLETISVPSPSWIKNSIYLDNIARWFYEISLEQ